MIQGAKMRINNYTLFGLLMLLLPMVLALSIGQVVTQNQYNNQDFTTTNYDITFDSLNVEDGYIKFDFSYNYLSKLNTNNYIIERNDYQLKFKVSKYIGCKNKHNKTYCISETVDWVRDEMREFKQNLIMDLESQKTETEVLTKKDFNLGELN